MIKEEGKLIYIKDGKLEETKVFQVPNNDSLFIEIIVMIDGEAQDLFYYKGQNKWMQKNKDFDEDDPKSYQYLPYDKYEIKKVILTTTIE